MLWYAVSAAAAAVIKKRIFFILKKKTMFHITRRSRTESAKMIECIEKKKGIFATKKVKFSFFTNCCNTH